MAGPVTEQEYVELMLENLTILATQEEPCYEKVLTEAGQEVYVVVGTKRAVTPASLTAMATILNSKIVQKHFSELNKENTVNTREALAQEKNLEITDERI